MIFYNTISSYHNPHAIIIFAFSLQNIKFLQNRQIALDGALAHRQDLRHFFPCYCRRLVNKTKYFPLADSLSVEMPATGAAMVSNGLLAADNPLLRQAEANVETQRLNALSARGRLMPSIFLNAGISDYYYSHQGQTNESFGRQMDVNFGQYVGVSVSIPLFDGLSRINGYRKARNRYVAAQIALERQRLQLDTDFSQAVIDRDNFAKEIVKMERKVDADSVAYALARRKYDEGLMDVLDLRKSADNWFASQAELVRCRLLFDVKRRLANYYITNKIFD